MRSASMAAAADHHSASRSPLCKSYLELHEVEVELDIHGGDGVLGGSAGALGAYGGALTGGFVYRERALAPGGAKAAAKMAKNAAVPPAKLKELIKQSDVVINLAAICNPSEYIKQPVNTINSKEATMKVFIEKYADKVQALKRTSDEAEPAAKKAKA